MIENKFAGLGGCPYAPGAAGNLATEDIVYMLQGMGIEYGDIDLYKLALEGAKMCNYFGRPTGSKCGLAVLAAVGQPGTKDGEEVEEEAEPTSDEGTATYS